jgi:hypothetical protein
MARIDRLEQRHTERTKLHAPVEASFQVLKIDGKTFLQIDTYGSPDRKFAGRVSQSLQFGPEGLAALRAILARLD